MLNAATALPSLLKIGDATRDAFLFSHPRCRTADDELLQFFNELGAFVMGPNPFGNPMNAEDDSASSESDRMLKTVHGVTMGRT